jgi:hypothetical protein
VRESLYTQAIIWVHTIPTHIDTREILPRYEDSWMVYRPEWYRKAKNSSNTHTVLESKNGKPSPTDIQMVSNEDDTSPTLEWKTKVAKSLQNLRNRNEKQRHQMPLDMLY